MSLTNPIVAEDSLFLLFSLEEIDIADCFFFNQMFYSIPDISTVFYLYNSYSPPLPLFPPNSPHFNNNNTFNLIINNLNDNDNNTPNLINNINDDDNNSLSFRPHSKDLPLHLQASIPFKLLSDVSLFSSLTPPIPTDSFPQIDFTSEDTLITDDDRDVESAFNGRFEINLTPYFCVPQNEAAQKLRIRAHILSKKWKDATNNKMWPYRSIRRLDREILTIMKNIELGTSPTLTDQLGELVAKRQKLVSPVRIKLP